MGVQVKSSGNSLHIQVDHAVLSRADGDLLAGCIEAVLECCGTSGCCDGRVALNERCLATVAAHNAAVKCIDRCFGCQ